MRCSEEQHRRKCTTVQATEQTGLLQLHTQHPQDCLSGADA